ncbi:hypothetical protein G6F57_019909 [Rhizopus arrhizus]|nr:hypothetical protein G6F57_019909 [Rhizopus arrhizus]
MSVPHVPVHERLNVFRVLAHPVGALAFDALFLVRQVTPAGRNQFGVAVVAVELACVCADDDHDGIDRDAGGRADRRVSPGMVKLDDEVAFREAAGRAVEVGRVVERVGAHAFLRCRPIAASPIRPKG